MTDKELRKLIFEYRGVDVNFKAYPYGEYIYILGIGDSDDRKARAGGGDFIRFNKETEKIEKIHYLDIPSEIFENEPKPTKESIATGIVKRQYVNERDMLHFTEIIYEKSDAPDFNFGKIFYDYKRDREKIRVHFRSEEIRDKFKVFLEGLNVKCVIDYKGWLELMRVPEK